MAIRPTARWRRRLMPVAAVVGVARLAVAVPVTYLSVLTVAAWFGTVRRRRRSAGGAPSTVYAVLVPAHDEEQVIGATLDAMAALDYPADRYAVHVVADHCMDRTVEIARKHGVTVHEHDQGACGKGPALQWALGCVLSGPAPDVVVIVDADTIVAPGFLRAIDRAVGAGARVVQGQYRVRDPGESVGAGLRAAALALRHHLRPLGRTTLGASSGLYGNGMAFHSEVVRRRQWTDHLTEDIEFQMELLLDGILVDYAPDAVVEAEMPATLAGAQTQNERWERGRLELARRYVPALVRASLRRDARRAPRVAAIDGALDHLVPPLSVLVVATGGVAAAGTVVALARGRGLGRAGWWLVAALGGHITSGLLLARVPLSVYRSLAHAPAMVLWKVRLWLRMLRPGSVGWIRTARTGAEGPT